MGRMYDQRGRYLGEAPPAADAQPWAARLWELFHPFTVQDEYAAVGKDAPPVSEIVGDAASAIQDEAATGIQTAASAAVGNLIVAGKWLIIGAVAYGAYQLYTKVKR